MPLAQRDEQGLYVPGYRVAPNCGADFSDEKIRRCPISNANRLAPLIAVYHRHRQGLGNIATSYPKPTCAILEAFDVLHYSTEEMIARQREQALQESSNG